MGNMPQHLRIESPLLDACVFPHGAGLGVSLPWAESGHGALVAGLMNVPLWGSIQLLP